MRGIIPIITFPQFTRWLYNVMKFGTGTYGVEFDEGLLRAIKKGKSKFYVKL